MKRFLNFLRDCGALIVGGFLGALEFILLLIGIFLAVGIGVIFVVIFLKLVAQGFPAVNTFLGW